VRFACTTCDTNTIPFLSWLASAETRNLCHTIFARL
jgi:hypothetical protein